MFTFGSLFTGIGGLDLGLERAGMQCAWQVEIDDYATKVLQKHWPDVTRFRDVRTVGKHNLSRVDLIAGGFPCQPHSLAGERKASGDDRNLWPEFYRLICELRPRWIVAENVLGLLSSENGRFFGGVLRDLAEAGYDAEWRVLRASDFGAPHRRERVILMAYPCSERQQQIAGGAFSDEGQNEGRAAPDDYQFPGYGKSDRAENVADPEGERGDGGGNTWNRGAGFTDSGSSLADSGCTEWRPDPERRGYVDDWTNAGREEKTSRSELRGKELADPKYAGQQGGERYSYKSNSTLLCRGSETRREFKPGVCRVLNGFPSGLDGHIWPAGPGQEQYEWEPRRVVTEKVPNRTARLKTLGNAVVPQLAEYIGRCILAAEE